MHDESDYGTGFKQIMSEIYYEFHSNKNLKIIGFSASNEELTFSNLEPYIITYEPPKNYRGAKHYIDNNLVYEAEPFFDKQSDDYLSEQGKKIINEFYLSDKTFLVVRLADGFPDYVKNTTALLNAINKHNNNALSNIEPVTKNNSWDWGFNGHWRRFAHDNNKVLVIICQTAARSVEFCKPLLQSLFALHDYRGNSCSYSTKIQAMLRPAHFYEELSDNNIRPFIYGCYLSIQLAANLENCKDKDARAKLYLAYEDKLSLRITNSSGYNYQELIFNSKPNDKDIFNRCLKNGIKNCAVSYIPKYRNIGKTPSDDLALAVLNGVARSTNFTGGIPCYHIDYASIKYPNSFLQLLNAGYRSGQYVVLIPISKKAHNTSSKSVYQNLNLN